MKAQALIEDAFIEIGILVAGSSLSANDLAWGKRKFNSLLKTLSVDGLSINFLTKESFPLVSGTSVYTIGTGGDFDTIRPASFDAAFIREQNIDYGVSIKPIQDYWGITDKTIPNRPQTLFYDRQVPLGVVYLDYVPDQNYELHFTTLKPFTTYDVIASEDVDVPGEHEEMLISNLAVRLASRYGRSISRELSERAKETLKDIKSVNLAKTMIGVDCNFINGGNGYDIEVG